MCGGTPHITMSSVVCMTSASDRSAPRAAAALVVEVVRMFFFFQAEDGIRDYKVTGVQTCALPISQRRAGRLARIVSSAIEHPAVQGALDELAREGFAVTRLPVAPGGTVAVDDLRDRESVV